VFFCIIPQEKNLCRTSKWLYKHIGVDKSYF
jgi:hypothetical protein